MGLLQKIKEHDFIKSVAVLVTGTILAQLFSFLISPLLTRIYTPEEMGDLNLYLRIVSFLSVLATARFELSLPLPKNDQHSYLLYRLSIRIAIYTLLGVSLISVFYFMTIGINLKLFLFVAMTILSTAFLVLVNLGTNWSIRKKEYRKISISKMLNSGVSNILRWLFGVLGMGSFGLILASLIGSFLSSLTFIRQWFKLDKQHLSFRSDKKTRALASAYREFPTINLPHALVDLGKDLLLAFLMIYFFSKEVFAWYSHSLLILQIPISLIGLSISQVFFSRCAELVNEGQSTVSLLRKTVISLFLLSILPFTVLFFFGTPLFAFVFGENWSNAGYYSEIMSVWFLLNFLNSVVSTLPTVLRRQKEFFYLGIISAFIQLTGFGVLPIFLGANETTFPTILWIVSITQSVFFVFVLLAMFRFARLGIKN